ncbi:hypothetical protein GCM10010211_32840 [Streptomyces albospinus]|uniref:Beta-ketoacyl synthase N-terminal domain-containing protein n=1 Tax=Streptomyces albospinus TaxID=285515 RepID=A0ABQ2V2G2_9ACTN|nr:hypothetical protein [Streptomyces albospinus]GGU65161.1 hypothetical protein GCM10010211_32840 [Streptomyces albospinus]
MTLRPSQPAADRIAEAGLSLRSQGHAPAATGEPLPPLRGFTGSTFSPATAAAAAACLHHQPPDTAQALHTAVILVSILGDIPTARTYAQAVDEGQRVPPRIFGTSTPNSVIGHIAPRWGLDGPVVSLSPVGPPLDEGIAVAACLAQDGDANRFLIILTDPTDTRAEHYEATALLLTTEPRPPSDAAPQETP